MAKDGPYSTDKVIIAEVVSRRKSRGGRDECSGRGGRAEKPCGLLAGGRRYTERCAEEVGLDLLRRLGAGGEG